VRWGVFYSWLKRNTDKFYLSMFNRQLNLKQLYPRSKNKSLDRPGDPPVDG
jgi:hypothetical protein